MKLQLLIRLPQVRELRTALLLFKQTLGKQTDFFLVIDTFSTQLQTELDLFKAERVFSQVRLDNSAIYEKESEVSSSLPDDRIIIYIEEFSQFYECFEYVHCPRDTFSISLTKDDQGKSLVVQQGKSYHNQREFKSSYRIQVKTLNNYQDQFNHHGSAQQVLRA